ncbi:MAG: M67 family metallopeptidase [Ilumatobacteraceae bacterium]|nr:M67 family metallopeptidase [Ilumatobacteraceae bacterium]
MLVLSRQAFDALVDTAYDAYPMEGCGLIAGPVDDPDTAVHFYPCRNAAESARVYTIDPKDHLHAELDADDRDWLITGVVHSHTHTEPYPSPTDIAQAPDPSWHYVIVSLKRDAPEVRSYRIVAGVVTEEPVRLDS